MQFYLFLERVSNSKSATFYGKGDVDGIGQQIKHLEWIQMLSKKSIINSALIFFNAVKEKDTKIQVIHIKGEGMHASENALNMKFYDALAIPNFKKCIIPNQWRKTFIFYSQYSLSKHFQTLNLQKERNSKMWEVTVSKENYYVVYCDQQYYARRVIDGNEEKVKMEF